MSQMNPPVVVSAICLFVSGFCALIFQVGWLREFSLIFGGSTHASAAVLAIFMAGLGLGNAFLGPFVDRCKNPFQVYGKLEFGVAVIGGLTPLLLDLVGWVYTSLGGQEAMGATLAGFVRVGLSSVAIGLPTFLMGGTIPAAAKAVTKSSDYNRRAISIIYAFNTLGAVAGTIASSLVLLPSIGTRSTLLVAAATTLVLSLVVLKISVRSLWNEPGSTNRKTEASPLSDEGSSAETDVYLPRWFLYSASGIIGFTFFLMEIVWFRMLGPILGGTTYTFGVILSVALAGIGIGSLLNSVCFYKRKPIPIAFSITCGLEALALAVPYYLGDQLALWAAQYRVGADSFMEVVVGWYMITAITVLPAAIISGFQFPLLISLLGKADKQLGNDLGRCFAANTLGAIVGSIAGGFGLLPLLSAPGCWRVAVTLLATLGAASVGFSLRPARSLFFSLQSFSLALAVISLVALFGKGPTAFWRHNGIGAGRFTPPKDAGNDFVSAVHNANRQLVWELDGVESSIGIVVNDGTSFYVNGKSDGHATRDAGTQIMLGMLGSILHPSPKEAFVVGLGTGETAGWLGSVPTIDRVDVVELEPSVVEMTRRCRDLNNDVLAQAKVVLHFGDARETLLTTSKHYDLIVSEPSNPYRAGVANLFTQEFYEAVSSRLKDGGLFVQWLQGYEIDEKTMFSVAKTIKAVFPHVEVWQSKPEDMLFVCSETPVDHNLGRVTDALATQPYSDALRYAWRAGNPEAFYSHFVAGSKLFEGIVSNELGVVNTDDLNGIEYAFARSLGRREVNLVERLRELAVVEGVDIPNVDVDRMMVDSYRQLRLSMYSGEPRLPVVPRQVHQERARILDHYWRGDTAKMISAYQETPYPLLFPDETALFALAFAKEGRAEALQYADSLSQFQPFDGLIIRAVYHFQRDEVEKSVQYLSLALGALRVEPWGFQHGLELPLPLLAALANSHPAVASECYSAVSEPLSAYILEHDRWNVSLQIGSVLGVEQVETAIERYEPFPLWNLQFLRLRREVYSSTGNPKHRQSEIDLMKFLSLGERYR